MSQKELIEQCLKNKPKAQNRLYNLYSPKMYGVCLRFAKHKYDADDICQEGFIKVFRSLSTFRNEGSLEGWIRRIMVTTAINYYHRVSKYIYHVDNDQEEIIPNEEETPFDKISTIDLLKYIQQLPDGYRMVFNLFEIEGYKHREIAEILNISKNTSKSQLIKARINLQKIIKLRF